MPSTPRPPRVSVIVPVYRATFLHQALRSVEAQDHPPDEVILVDDGSPDRRAIEEAAAMGDHRIRLIRQANLGAAAARNTGLQAATGEVVAFLDADDRWHPRMIGRQLSLLRISDCDVVYADGDLVFGDTTGGARFMDKAPSWGPVTLASLLSQTCTIMMSSVVARREAIERAGGFDAAIRRGHDFDLWIRMAHAGLRFTYTREVLVARRIHEDNLSGTQRDELTRAIEVLAKTLRTLPLDEEHRLVAERRRQQLEAWLAREDGKEHLRRGEVSEAVWCLSCAARHAPGWKTRAALVALHVAPVLAQRLYHWRRGRLAR